MFEIDYLSDKQVLRWRMKGFWTEATAMQFRDALAKEMAKVRKICPRFYSLSDTREFPVQSEAVMKLLASNARDPMAQGSRKLAILVATTLNQLQAQRSFSSSDRIRVFRDEDEAFAWLAEPSSEHKAVVNG